MDHSYLIIGLLTTSAGLFAARVLRGMQWFVLTAGLLAAPAGFADVIFVPEYWQPVHVIGEWFSIEGVLFSFGNGCLIAAMIGKWFPDASPNKPQVFWRPGYRCGAVMLPGFLVFLLAWEQGFGSLMIMHAAFLGFLVIFGLLAVRRWLSLRIAMATGLGFSVIYGMQTLLWYGMDPSFGRFWAGEPYFYVLQTPPFLPVEEFIWAFLYGALWSSLMLFAFEARLPHHMQVNRT